LELTLEKNVLKIGAVRKAPEGDRTYWHNERGYGRVERTVNLPETVDGESIDAQLKDGILTVKLQKRPESLPKRIEIKS
jgi:HSP20 family protein